MARRSMTTLTEERAASQVRRDADTDERMRETRARTLRRTLAEWVDARVSGRKPTIREVALFLWPTYDDDRMSRVIEDALAMHGEGKHVKQLNAEETYAIALAYVKDNPHAVAREVFNKILETGRSHHTIGTFSTGIMVDVRKELGIKWTRKDSRLARMGPTLAEVDAEAAAKEDSDRNDAPVLTEELRADSVCPPGSAVSAAGIVAAVNNEEQEEDAVARWVGVDRASPFGEVIRIHVPGGGKLNAVHLEGDGDLWSVRFVGVVERQRVIELCHELTAQVARGGVPFP